MHTLGAYLGTAETWSQFRSEWEAELEKWGLQYFHMTDFEFARSRVIANKAIPSRSPFHGWNKNDFVPFLQQLHSVINQKSQDGRYRLEGWASSIIQSDFDACRPDSLEKDVQCCSYYVFNVIQMLKSIALWADDWNYHDPIHYVFAGGDGEGGNLERLFAYLWNRRDARAMFRLDKGYSGKPYDIKMMKAQPALQAADIVAFEMHKSSITLHQKNLPVPDLSDIRASWQSLGKTAHYGLFYSPDQLIKTFEEISRGEIVL